jgi:serine/threonine protein phosphatase PrpC
MRVDVWRRVVGPQTHVFVEKLTEEISVAGMCKGWGTDCAAAKFASAFLRRYLTHNLLQCQDHTKIEKMLRLACERCQANMMLHDDWKRFVETGSSVCLLVRLGDDLYLANAGDATIYCIMVAPRHSEQVLPIHTLQDSFERTRIIDSGGYFRDGRVCDRTCVTRGLGNLWQLQRLRWCRRNNLSCYDVRNMRTAGVTLPILNKMMRHCPPGWCIQVEPDTRHLALAPGMIVVMAHGAEPGWEGLLGEDLTQGIAAVLASCDGLDRADVLALGSIEESVSEGLGAV